MRGLTWLAGLILLLSFLEQSDGANVASRPHRMRRAKMKSPKRTAYSFVQASMTNKMRSDKGMDLVDWTKRWKRKSSGKTSWNGEAKPNILLMNKPYNRWARGHERASERYFGTINDRPNRSKRKMNLIRARGGFLSPEKVPPQTLAPPPSDSASPQPTSPVNKSVATPESPFRVPRRRKPIDTKVEATTTTIAPSTTPTTHPTQPPSTTEPTIAPTVKPTTAPTSYPTKTPSASPTSTPTYPPTYKPSAQPTEPATKSPVASVTSSLPPTRSPVARKRQPTTVSSLVPSHVPSYENASPLMWNRTAHLISDFDGEVFGAAMSLSQDGRVVTVGAFLNEVVAPDGGRIARYDITKSGSFAEVQGNEDAYLGFEVCVSSDGNRLAAFDSSAGTFHIYQYSVSTKEYEPLHSFDIDVFPGSADSALSGDGDWLVSVGEDYNSDTGITDIWATLYEYDDTQAKFIRFGEPTLFGTTDASDWGYFDVAITDSGQYLVVSQLGRDEFIGEIRTYKRTQHQLIEIGSPFFSQDLEDDFGHEVEILVTTTGQLMVGFSVLFEDAVYVYALQDDIQWTLMGQPILATDVLDDVTDVGFGYDISFSDTGKRVVIGAPDYGDGKGAVQAFDFRDGSWSATGNLLSGPEGSRFGEAVKCNVDCTIVAVGAPEDCLDADQNICGGSVYLYQDA